MTLTPEILAFAGRLTDEEFGRYARSFLDARGRAVPVEIAHEEAFDSALGLGQSTTEAERTAARQAWAERAEASLNVAWAVYLVELGQAKPEATAPMLTDMIRTSIRRCFGAWRQDRKSRRGRTVEQCVKDQVIGCFLEDKETWPTAAFEHRARRRRFLAGLAWAQETFDGQPIKETA